MNKVITSPSNPRIKELASLPPSSPYFLVEGRHLVEEAIKAGYAEEIFSLKEEDFPLPITLISEPVLRKLTKTVTPEGLVALCRKPDETGTFGEKVLYLDAVQDPGNVGTLLRTALAFSFTDIVFSSGTASPFSHKVTMASQGAIFHLSLHFDEGEILSSLKKQGYSLICTHLEGKEDIELPKGKRVLILGNEGQGVSKEVAKMSDVLFRLPISGIDSLNVAVAGAICMYLMRD